MAVKAKPVTRQELLEKAVTDVDAFTALRYLRHRETVPSFPDLEEKGQKTLPGLKGLYVTSTTRSGIQTKREGRGCARPPLLAGASWADTSNFCL